MTKSELAGLGSTHAAPSWLPWSQGHGAGTLHEGHGMYCRKSVGRRRPSLLGSRGPPALPIAGTQLSACSNGMSAGE